MIANEADLQSNLSTLQKTLTLTPVDLSERMDASQMNSTEQDIYNTLNTLYEKIRILEDIKDYMRKTMLATIAEKKKKLNEILINIEKNNDIYTSDKKQGVSVSYTWSTDTVKDRDGTELSSLIYDSNMNLYPQGNIAYQADILKMSHECQDVPFTFEKSEDNGYYHVQYLKNKPDFVDDTLTIIFKEPRIINYIDCDIYNASYIVSYLNDKSETTIVSDNCYIEPVTAYGLVIEFIGDKYDTITQSIDKAKQSDDSFSNFNKEAVSLSDTESESASELQSKHFDSDITDYARKVDSQ